MPIHNSDIADIFSEVADYLEIKGENPFRIRAYRNAARTVGDLSQEAGDLLAADTDLTTLPGIGADLAGKIEEIVKTGKLGLLEELKGDLPGDLTGLMAVAGLGPKRVKALYEDLGIKTLSDLRDAAKSGKIRKVSGFGEKTEENILEELKRLDQTGRRTGLREADRIARSCLDYLKKSKGIKELQVAGSYRRRKETVGDLDVLVSAAKDSDVMERFVEWEDVETVISHGKTRASVRLGNDFQMDLRVVPAVSFGAALHYFTGSKAHNIAVRKLGVKKGLKINEYGVFKGKKRIAGRKEKEVFDQVGLAWIPPELREDRGEIDAARKDELPDLVSVDDIRGDLHAHTKLTDGRFTLGEMAEAAKKKGYDYLAITEHSKRVTVAKGLDAKKLARQIEEIDAFNEKVKGITILRGIEVDILEDGSLDLPDSILKELDLVVCSVHYKFNLSRKKQTERIIRAMDNPYFNILSHPTGRLIFERPPYDVNMEEIMEAAKERGCFLEVNSQPDRLDLNDVHCKMAKDMGVKVAISTDAHSTVNLDFMRYGAGQARRGWLEADDVINTMSLPELRKLLKRG